MFLWPPTPESHFLCDTKVLPAITLNSEIDPYCIFPILEDVGNEARAILARFLSMTSGAGARRLP